MSGDSLSQVSRLLVKLMPGLSLAWDKWDNERVFSLAFGLWSWVICPFNQAGSGSQPEQSEGKTKLKHQLENSTIYVIPTCFRISTSVKSNNHNTARYVESQKAFSHFKCSQYAWIKSTLSPYINICHGSTKKVHLINNMDVFTCILFHINERDVHFFLLSTTYYTGICCKKSDSLRLILWIQYGCKHSCKIQNLKHSNIILFSTVRNTNIQPTFIAKTTII